MKTIGIIGQGFVGGALRDGMKHACNVETYDKFQKDRCTVFSIKELCQKAKIVFVCVPTPMKTTGACDVSIIESVVKEISDCSLGNIVVIKSTVSPGMTRWLDSEHPGIDGVLMNPEFLTEANALQDFKTQDRIVLGSSSTASGKRCAELVTELYNEAYPGVPVINIESTAAELVKYMTNCFLATKVAFANEMYQICSSLGIDYDVVSNAAMLDKRLGDSHWRVPGPMPADDGSGRLLFGFGGSCFVKDINALIHLTKRLGIDAKVLCAAWEKNIEVRPERDWEHLQGRAVSKE